MSTTYKEATSCWAKLFHQFQLLRTVNLGVYIDEYLTYDVHVTKTVSSCINQLVQIGRINRLLDKKTRSLLINSFVFSKRFYFPRYGGTNLNVTYTNYSWYKILLPELY